MRQRLALIAFTTLVLAACGGGDDGPAAPSTSQTARIIAFGDSLTDGGTYSRGNALILQSQAGVPAEVASLVGRFTNSPGAVWVEVLAGKLGTSLVPERFEVGPASAVAASNGLNTAANATNYAQGGARVAGVPGIGCNPDAAGACTAQAAVPVTTQVDRALAKGRFSATDLVVIWAGANDVFYNAGLAGAEIQAATVAAGAGLSQAQTQAIVGKYVIAMEEAALATVREARRVQSAGAERVLLMTVPNPAQSPYGVSAGASTQSLMTALVNAYNQQLQSEVTMSATGFQLFDAAALSAGWYANPTANGLANVQLPVCDVPTALGSSSQFCFITAAAAGSAQNPFARVLPAGATADNSMFADGVHPSVVSHAKFGDAVYTALKAANWVR